MKNLEVKFTSRRSYTWIADGLSVQIYSWMALCWSCQSTNCWLRNSEINALIAGSECVGCTWQSYTCGQSSYSAIALQIPFSPWRGSCRHLVRTSGRSTRQLRCFLVVSGPQKSTKRLLVPRIVNGAGVPEGRTIADSVLNYTTTKHSKT